MPSEILQALSQTITNGFRRKSIVSCSRWAEKCRIMGKPFPGPYSFIHFPWAREMHDCDAEKWCGQKAAQVGFTEVALNRVFFTIDIKRVDCLYVLPAQTPDATQFSASRFDPALQLSPYLKDLFSDVNNIGHKRAGGTNLYVRGSRSKSGLKSIPAGLLVLDELDEMNQTNLPLASERQSGQIERQEINISTPTIAGTGINLVFEESSQDSFHFQCPHCTRWTQLTFPESIVITADDIHDPRIADTHLICNLCKAKLPHESKTEWLATGKWVPKYKNRAIRGFHINQLYSPAQTPSILATKFFKSKIDQSDEQNFYNSNLGMVHEVKGARVNDEVYQKCINNYTLLPSIPYGTIVTMGCDQGSLLHYEICAWQYIGNSNPSLIGTDLNLRFRPRIIDVGTLTHFEDLDKLMIKWKIRAAVIDAHPEKRKALEFAARFDGLVYLCFYGEGNKSKNITVWSGEPCITVDRTSWLDLALGRFHSSLISLPKNMPLEYRKHIMAPVRVPSKDQWGNPVSRYVTGDGVADHYAHARNYSEIALNFAATGAMNQSMQSPR